MHKIKQDWFYLIVAAKGWIIGRWANERTKNTH